ncbi:MAG TPA: glycosyltransferase [Candidatus Methylomirabilis sp.]|nr:glycosyltransferase [Candidatus Methylomirabilis sp.]
MRIAMLSDNFYPELSGISDSALTLAQELARRGHSIHFYVPRYAGADYRRLNLPPGEVELGKTIGVSRLASWRYPTGTRQGRVVLPSGLRWRRIREFQPDILHVHLPFPVGLEGVIAAGRLKTPLVGTSHTPLTEFLRYSPIGGAWGGRMAARYTAWFYNHCAFVSSPCEAIFQEMEACGFRAPHRVIPNPIRLDVFHPLPDRPRLKRAFGFSESTILYAGRLAPEKHLDLIVRAVASLASQAPGILLALLGSGSAEGDLRSLCRSLGVAERVRFLGYVPDLATVAEVYNASDVFAIPSTAETQSLAAMQAMACGLPVVGARSWGLREYITEANGLLVDPGDEHGLREALASLLRRPDARLRLGNGGRESVARFSAFAIAAEWEEVYRGVIQTHGGGMLFRRDGCDTAGASADGCIDQAVRRTPCP